MIDRQFGRPVFGKRLTEQMLEDCGIVPENVARQVGPSTRRPGWAAVGLAEADRRDTAVDKRIVLGPQEAVFLQQHRVVVIHEEISHDADLRHIIPAASRRNRIGRAVAALVAVEVHEDVAFEMGVGAVQVGTIVSATEKETVVDLHDRTGPLPPGKIDHIVIAGGGAKGAPFEDQLLRSAQTDAVDGLGSADRWKDAVACDDRRMIHVQNPRVGARPGHIIEFEAGMLDIDRLALTVAELHIDATHPIRFERVVESNSLPVPYAAWHTRQADALIRRAFDREPPALPHLDPCTLVEEYRRSRFDAEGSAGIDAQRR